VNKDDYDDYHTVQRARGKRKVSMSKMHVLAIGGKYLIGTCYT